MTISFRGLTGGLLVVLALSAQSQGLFLQDELRQVTNFAGINYGAWSPDGLHFYAAAETDDTLIALAPDENGDLMIVQVVRDGENGVAGLAGASSVVIAPDGLHAYATGSDDDAVSAFSRDPATGMLTFVAAYFDPGDSSLNNPGHADVSPDNRHVYVRANNGVQVFSRNATTGALTFVQSFRDSSDLGGGNASQVRVSPDGANVYATADSADSLFVFARNATTGELTFVEFFEEPPLFGTPNNPIEDFQDPLGLAISPDGSNVYVVTFRDDSLIVFDRDTMTGQLTVAQTMLDDTAGVDGLDGARDVALSPDGANVYVASAVDDSVAVFDRDANGRLTFREARFWGQDGVENLEFPREVAVSPDGLLVLAISRSGRSIVGFDRDLMTGSLTFAGVTMDAVGDLIGLDGASAIAARPAGSTIYTAGSRDHAIGVFAIDRPANTLRFVEAEINGMNNVTGLLDVNDVDVTPDGLHVYAVSPTSDLIAGFQVNGLDNEIDFVQARSAPGLNGPRNLAISQDGRYVYVTGRLDNAIVVFARDFVTGYLHHIQTVQNEVDGVMGLSSPDGLALPTGMLVAALSFQRDLAVFLRDEDTGMLSFQEIVDGPPLKKSAHPKGSDDRYVEVIRLPQNSGDGKIAELIEYLLTGGESPHGSVMYTVDVNQHALTFVQTIESHSSGAAPTGNGCDVYMTDRFSGSLAEFSCDQGTGMLTMTAETPMTQPRRITTPRYAKPLVLAANVALAMFSGSDESIEVTDITVRVTHAVFGSRNALVLWRADNIGDRAVEVTLRHRGTLTDGEWEVIGSSVPALPDGTKGTGAFERTITMEPGHFLGFNVRPGRRYRQGDISVVRAIAEGDDFPENNCSSVFEPSAEIAFRARFENVRGTSEGC